MAVILIDTFNGTNTGDPTIEVRVLVRDDNGAISSTPDDMMALSYETYDPPRVPGTIIYAFCIGTVKHVYKASLEYPFAYDEPEEDPVFCAIAPPTCDLAITDLVTDETSQGAADGSNSVTATSSFANPQVSIDNVTFFPSPKTFGPLAPGNYVIYAKDDNGCTKTKDFNIEAYDNPISGGFAGGLPQVEVGPGLISRWNAAFNPIVFNFQNTPDPLKKNFGIEIELTTIYGSITGRWSPGIDGKTRCDVSGFLQTVVNAKDSFDYGTLNWRDINRAASFTVRYRQTWDGGSSVWFYAPQPLYVTWSAMQLQDKYGGNMAEYVPMTTGGAVTPAPFNYNLAQSPAPYVDVDLQIKANAAVIKDVFVNEIGSVTAPVGNSYSIEAYSGDAPDTPDGWIYLKISKNGVLKYWQKLPSVIGASLSYGGIVDYGATYDIIARAVVGEPDIVATNIPDSTTPTPSGTNLAKWLTLFDEPTAWPGLPFDNSFIFSEYIIGKVVKLRTTSLDINKQPVSGGVTNGFLLNNDAGYVLNTDLSRLIIQQGALPPIANDGILEQLGINRLLLAGNAAAGVEYFQIQLYVGADLAPEYVTQPLIIKINPLCNEPYVYLKWLNTLGGWDYYRFGHDQIKQLTTENGQVIDRNVFDWQNDDTIADVVKKSAARRMTIGAQISEVKIRGLEGLHLSTKVMLLTSVNPMRWQTVIVSPGSFDIRRTRSRVAELRFTITLPEINIQINGSVPQQIAP